ncbi:MAG: crosslink repair DNA glycosylase YcaQ family protein, partial [Chloroflexota bacterium]
MESISPSTARQLSVSAQRLAEPLPPPSKARMLDILHSIRCLQLDPIRAVDRTQYLVLWSRLGQYDRNWLHELTYQDKALFEYWAHAASLVLTEDYPIHAHLMARYGTDPKRKLAKWIKKNQTFKAYVLGEIDRRGPLLTKDLEDRADVPWGSSGWTNDRSLPYMLDYLWTKGEIMVSNRDGLKRWWDLTERVLPSEVSREGLSDHDLTSLAIKHALRSLGIGRARDIKKHFTEGRYPTLKPALEALEARGDIKRVSIPDWGEEPWFIPADHYDLAANLASETHPFERRVTLLSPFDHLIRDRDRTELMWNFYYRIEIYVPKAKREYGYYVLPILDGERLIGRVDSRMDRKNKVYNIEKIYVENGAPLDEENGIGLLNALKDLGRFVGADQLKFHQDLNLIPQLWRPIFRNH